LPIVLISLAVLLVLCVGGGVAIYLAARNTVDGIADSVDDRPSARPPAATTEATPRRTISVVEPSKLNGRPKLTNPQFADVAEDLETAFGQLPGAGKTVSALYGTPAERDVVVIAAAEADVADPARMLSGTFLGAGVGGMEVTGLQTVEAGPLGGTAKCGTVDETDLELIMCGWADEGSVGWVLWYFESMSKAKAEFPKLRGQIEKAS
jgi:hypothetical protein